MLGDAKYSTRRLDVKLCKSYPRTSLGSCGVDGREMTNAPIALFVYNRPAHTRHTVAALQKCVLADQSDLFIFSDAPRNPDAAEAVRQVRDYISTVDGFKSVTVLRQTENRGLARSITEGITRLCDERSRVIVMEDDLVTSPHFLEYMNAGLSRYEGEDRVMQIAGHMFPMKVRIEEDALLLPFITTWGWATWSRAWRCFERREDDVEEILADPATRRRFDLHGRYKYSKILRAQQRKKLDSWGIYWYLSVFRRDGLALFPKKTFVRNLGFDGSGVNCAVSEFPQDELDPDYRVAVLPDEVRVSRDAERVMMNIPATRISIPALMSVPALMKRLADVVSRQR